ncbi:hypothetical protein [Brevibacillus porteri]|nr:hypothetical protein [Brevibacillus porteri]MED1801858.1 hypothetical protein [Brevibacillus porteri]MED2134991.1 hypothetical protein [Brevibacillus porteri]MED2745511.1 hypothetical protein [Brevibacillus porteri]MED2815744.1 hypothetical protein [Brevibacillus porteri]MED2897581.1 hypothetical protein [Brevibacillus porteri]
MKKWLSGLAAFALLFTFVNVPQNAEPDWKRVIIATADPDW